MAKQEVVVDSVEMQAAELKRQRKADKKAASWARRMDRRETSKDAAAAETITTGEAEVADKDEAKRLRKAAKRDATEAAVEVKGAAVTSVPEEVDDVAAKRARKAAKKAVTEAAAEVECAVMVPVLDRADDVEAERQRKAAKKAAREAVASTEGAVEAHALVVDEDEAKRQRKVARRAAREAVASIEAAVEVYAPDVHEVEAKRQRKAAKVAARDAAAAAASEKQLEKPTKAGTKRAMEEAEIDKAQADLKRRNKKAIEDARKPASRRKSASAEDDAAGSDLAVFIRGLPWAVSQDMLRRDFSECGEIDRIKMPMNEEGKPRGFAFVRFVTSDGFNAALEFDNTEYGGRTVYVCKAGENTSGKGKNGKAQGKGGNNGRNNPLTVCIKELPYTVDEIALKKDFAECGEIAKMNMPRNAEGVSRGMAFITYKLQEGFDAAFKFDGTEYGGRTILVTKPLVGGEASSGKDKEGKAGKGKGKGKDSKGKGKAGKDGKSNGKDSKGTM